MTAQDTVKKNLFDLEGERLLLSEKMLYELSELASVVYERMEGSLQGEGGEAFFHGSKAESFLFDVVGSDDTPNEYFPLLREERLLSYSSAIAAFSVFLSEHFGDTLPWTEVPLRRARIAYVPAGKAEEAYMALASRRKDAAVFYANSAKDAVASLLAQKADLVMLPYRPSQGEPLPGTEHLWQENDLCISALVTVSEGEEKLTYALFARDLSPYAVSDHMPLYFRITADSFAHLGRMLSAFPFFGFSTSALRTEPEEYGRVRARISLTGDGNAMALWIYLLLYSAGFSFLGRCLSIETEI